MSMNRPHIITGSSNPLQQEQYLLDIVLQNPIVHEILDSNPFPDGQPWYLGAGGITQTVWNHLSKKDLTDGIDDYDLIYFDTNLDPKVEERHRTRICNHLKHLPSVIDVVNEARVHEWFEEYFHRSIEPYTSCEDAIDSWSPCSAIGLTKKDNEYFIYHSFDLDDLFNMVLRPNKNHQAQFAEVAYEKKAKKWKARWPKLTIVPWDTSLE